MVNRKFDRISKITTSLGTLTITQHLVEYCDFRDDLLFHQKGIGYELSADWMTPALVEEWKKFVDSGYKQRPSYIDENSTITNVEEITNVLFTE